MNNEESWKALNYAIRKKFKGDSNFSHDITINIIRNNKDGIAIFSEDIDNVYGDLSVGIRWDLFLNRDGTWKIV